MHTARMLSFVRIFSFWRINLIGRCSYGTCSRTQSRSGNIREDGGKSSSAKSSLNLYFNTPIDRSSGGIRAMMIVLTGFVAMRIPSLKRNIV